MTDESGANTKPLNKRAIPPPWIRKSSEWADSNPQRVQQRLKQIALGKNTTEYHNYINKVDRNARTWQHPWTPNPKHNSSKRAWDGQIRAWRRLLHEYESTPKVKENAADVKPDDNALSPEEIPQSLSE